MEKKYPIGGYAPGNYQCRCCSCGGGFFGDKRSVECEPCATTNRAKFDALSPSEQEKLIKRNIEIYNNMVKSNEQLNPDLLKVMQEAEHTKEDDMKKVKEEVGEEYSPATCEHKLPNGFSSWMFHSQTSGSGPDFYHDVSVCVCTQCGTIRVAGFRQGKDGKLNRFNEEIDIHAEEAIDAIIKYANYIREENVWGRLPQQRPVWVKASEQMPEHNVGVLVFIPSEDNHITSGMWDIDNNWVLLDEYRVPDCEVTHWMALPGLPEGVETFDLPDEIGQEIKKLARKELGLDEIGEKEVKP